MSSINKSLVPFVVGIFIVSGNISAEESSMHLMSDDGSASKFLMYAASVNQRLFASPGSFLCDVRMERYAAPSLAENGHIGAVDATVALKNGAEEYFDVREMGEPLPRLANGEHAWPEGEFGTLLKQTVELLASKHATFESEEPIESGHAAIYNFDVAAEASPWDFPVGDWHYRIPFHTRVWIKEPSGEIV